MSKILFINGPNLNLLGQRQVKLYGTKTIEDITDRLKKLLPQSTTLVPFQNNIEGEIVNFLNLEYLEFLKDQSTLKGIIINPAAYSHTSIAIRDALECFHEGKVKIVEVHLSNIHKREGFRHQSLISSVAHGVITGLGAAGYEMALEYILREDA